jgi:hypothetical protein
MGIVLTVTATGTPRAYSDEETNNYNERRIAISRQMGESLWPGM